MKQMKNVRARRRNYHWNAAEIQALIERGFVSFLPDDDCEDQESEDEKRHGMYRMARETLHFTDPEYAIRLDCELAELRRIALEREAGDRAIRDALARIVPSGVEASERTRTEGYLRGLLGLTPSDGRVRPPLIVSVEDSKARRKRLSRVPQRQSLLEWTGVYRDLWNTTAWRECMRLRYRQPDPVAITLLTRSLRRQLDRAAERCRLEVGAENVALERLSEVVSAIKTEGDAGAAHRSIWIAYAKARLRGDLTRQHRLYRPISQSGLFEEIAAAEAERQGSRIGRQETYARRFCHYLSVPVGHEKALLGHVLYNLLQLEGFVDDPSSPLPEFPGVRWPFRFKPADLRPSEDFHLISDRFAAALNINREVYSEIWQAYMVLRWRRLWEKRFSVSKSVFWASRILEGLRQDVFKSYGQWIDHFHAFALRPILVLERQGKADAALYRSLLSPFAEALTADPLLKCVFHSELFDGRDQLFSRDEKTRDDNRIRSILAAYSVRRLRDEQQQTPKIRVQDVLAPNLELSPEVQEAIQPSSRFERVEGFSHFAFVAPLITALVDQPGWFVSADNVQDHFHRYDDDPEVNDLLKNLPERLMKGLHGKILEESGS